MAVRSIVTACALLLVASGCGDEPNVDLTAGDRPTGTSSSTSVATAATTGSVGSRCTNGAVDSDARVDAVAGRLLNAPINAMVDRMQFGPEMIGHFGIDLHLGAIISVELIESAPLNILPGEDEGDPPTNSFAGNSAFASSALLEVDDGDEVLTVSYQLAAGGSEVLQSLGPVLEETDDALLVGLCAAVATSDHAGPELVAIGVSEAGRPHAVNPAFADVVKASSTMADLAAPG